jgi:geranylgeranyl pyrophosphate synthase
LIVDLPEGALGDPIRATFGRADDGLPQALARAASELGEPGESTEIAIEIAALLDAAEQTEAMVHGLAGVPDVEHDASESALAAAWLRLRAAELASKLGGDALERTSAALDEIADGWMLEGKDLYDAGRTPERYLAAIRRARGALGGLAAALGASTSGVPGDLVEQVLAAGSDLAVAARIRDDIVELTRRGAAGNAALRRGVYGLPVILAIAEHPSLSALTFGAISDAELESVLSQVEGAGAIELASQRCRDLVDSALSRVARREGSETFREIGQSILRESEGAAA